MIGIFLCIIGYLLGSVVFGLLFAKIFKIGDLTKNGSGNVGATNIIRVSGKRWIGVVTAVFDALKGLIPVLIAKEFEINGLELNVIGCLAVLGHIFPIWNGFKKGGKGIATFIGANLGLNFTIGIMMLIVWGITFLFKKISSLSSIIMVTTCIIANLFFLEFIQALPIFITAILILFKHQKNIIGLLHGSEKSLKI
jgi:glycerol-3-phosphate acyltransferase PlsY